MNTIEFISHLKLAGIQLWADGDRLRYETPSGVMTEQLLEEITARKSELLEFFSIAQKSKTSNLALIPTVPRNKPLATSFAQQGLWFMHQLAPKSAFYNVPFLIRLEGKLEVKALRWSLDQLVIRHESLRTTFTENDGIPQQIIHDPKPAEFRKIDITQGAGGESVSLTMQRFAEDEVQKPFDLHKGPLFRTLLLKSSEIKHVLVITMHHSITDGWSMGVLMTDLAEFYEARLLDKEPELNELPIQYADFAAWQHDRISGAQEESQLAFWKQHLADLPALHLQTDLPRQVLPSYRGARARFSLGKPMSDRIHALCREEGVTLFMTTLTAFSILLYRYTGQKDIVIGSPNANRNYPELESLIGFFVNSLVMRTDLSGSPTFRQAIARVRRVVLDTFANQDMPFERLVHEIDPERDLNQNPLFQVVFAVQNAPLPKIETAGLLMQPDWVETLAARFDLEFHIWEDQGKIEVTAVYNTDLFRETTIRRMFNHYCQLLDSGMENPDEFISDLQMISTEECQRLLFDWNATALDFDRDICIHQLFEKQVLRTPDAIALVFEEQQLSYAELSARANQVANFLRKLGVTPETLVGICMERSLEMPIGVLGILKAGGAYVPLDPAYPKDRLDFILEDTQLEVMLTQQSLCESFARRNIQTITLDSSCDSLKKESPHNPPCESGPSNLAYILYTSGSTGQPKGIAMHHRPLCNLISWQMGDTKLPVGSKTLQYAPISFDVSFQEIFSTWCAGGTLVLLDEEARHDPVALTNFIVDQSINRLFLPFTALVMLSELTGELVPTPVTLEHIIIAGEPLHITVPIGKYLAKLNGCALHNQYGPTESHVVTAFLLAGTPSTWPASPPIGRPIANSQIYILDERLQPVPVGVIGQLFIGGECLAREYFNRPELTEEKFLPDPYREGPESRIYKTGDLAKYLPDGNIEFMGRVDFQVKLRGYRIELGEIEAVLGQCSNVENCVVTLREDRPGDKRLVGYVACGNGEKLETSDLRDYLRERLPDYMIPSAIIVMDALPLTPNGKVNRRLLPKPDQASLGIRADFVAPNSPVEKAISSIWSELLGVDQIGVHDNFFELGGHSLLATRVVSRVCKLFKIDLPLRLLFEAPTISALAEKITILADGHKMDELGEVGEI